MIARGLILAAGLGTAAATSQFPAFSQAYVQRLGGAVDALEQVVADFDRSAAAEGLTRDAALAQMSGSAFVERRRADMETTFARHTALRRDLSELQAAGPFMRAYHAITMDPAIARAAWSAFEPALPLNLAGAIFAGIGGLLGLSAGSGLHRLLRSGHRRNTDVKPT